LYGQNIFGVIPVGNLPVSARRKLLNEISQNNIYKVDYSKLKREQRAGRPTYIYEVTVEPVVYIKMLKNFARAVGSTQLERVDPNQYKDTPPLKFQLIVDVWSSQLKEVKYEDGRVEHYDGYGANTLAPEPTNTIPVIELQTRLQSLN
jgi:hypothetical protein